MEGAAAANRVGMAISSVTVVVSDYAVPAVHLRDYDWTEGVRLN